MFTFAKRPTSSPLGHSADVALWLHMNGQTIPLGQTCSTGIMLQHDQHIVPGPAKVEVIVDGISHLSDVTITGQQAGSLWVDIVMVKKDAHQSAA